MAHKVQEDWITSEKAAEILTGNSGHPVSANYVRRLASQGKVITREIDKRTRLYRKSDVENRKVGVKRRSPSPDELQELHTRPGILTEQP